MCALALLQDYQEAMTEDQMYKLLNTVYEINHPKVGSFSLTLRNVVSVAAYLLFALIVCVGEACHTSQM